MGTWKVIIGVYYGHLRSSVFFFASSLGSVTHLFRAALATFSPAWKTKYGNSDVKSWPVEIQDQIIYRSSDNNVFTAVGVCMHGDI